MGVALNVDYEADIVNVSEILEMTKARCQLFCDSVELQRLTLQQVSYVLNYETDASQVTLYLCSVKLQIKLIVDKDILYENKFVTIAEHLFTTLQCKYSESCSDLCYIYIFFFF